MRANVALFYCLISCVGFVVVSAGLGKAWEHYLNLVPVCRVSLGSPSPRSLEAFLGQLPIQMLGLDLERELAFLDKPTRDLVLVVRYVCAFVIKREIQAEPCSGC